MPIQTLHDTGENYMIPSKFDGAVYAVSTDDCVCGGVGDEFYLNSSSDSLDVYFNAGSEAVIGGSFFKVTSTETIHLAANSTIYLCAEIDLSAPNGQRGLFAQKTASNMSSDNINGSGTKRDLLLYVITTSTTGVVSSSDKRVIRGNNSSISGVGIRVMTEAQYNALPSKDPNTLYFLTES